MHVVTFCAAWEQSKWIYELWFVPGLCLAANGSADETLSIKEISTTEAYYSTRA
jgi:hypothetical protein